MKDLPLCLLLLPVELQRKISLYMEHPVAEIFNEFNSFINYWLGWEMMEIRDNRWKMMVWDWLRTYWKFQFWLKRCEKYTSSKNPLFYDNPDKVKRYRLNARYAFCEDLREQANEEVYWEDKIRC